MTKTLPCWWQNAGCFLHTVLCGLSVDRCQLCDHTDWCLGRSSFHISLLATPPPQPMPRIPLSSRTTVKSLQMCHDNLTGQALQVRSICLQFNFVWGELLDEREALVGVRPVRWKLDGLFSNGPPQHLHKCVCSCPNLGTQHPDHFLIKDLLQWSRQWLRSLRPLYESTASGWWFGVSDGMMQLEVTSYCSLLLLEDWEKRAIANLGLQKAIFLIMRWGKSKVWRMSDC